MIGARIAYKKAKEASVRSKAKKQNKHSELIGVISELLNSEEETFSKKKALFDNEAQKANALGTFYEIEKPVLVSDATFIDKCSFRYLELSWFVKEHITTSSWFEGFILVCILSVAVSTGLSLDGYDSNPSVKKFDYWVANITFYVFVLEVILKLISFGKKPYVYFVDKGGNGIFNCFDFILSALSIALIGQSSAGAIRTLRLGRLVRLLTIIKNVPELKVIVIGLIAGLKSVVYIVALLILVIYLYAVLGVIVLSENDRGNFGTVSVAMVTLFQISTLTSWSTIAYVSWHGCDIYQDGYVQVDDKKDLEMSRTMTGPLPTWECLKGNAQPVFTFIYFTSFTIVAAMVVMSLFIGVITMGMFDAVEQMKTVKAAQDYKAGVLKLKNDMFPLEGEGNALTVAVDKAMKRWPTRANEHRFINVGWRKDLNTFCHRAKKLEESKYFNVFITVCIAISGIVIGLQVDKVGDAFALAAVDFATLLVFTIEIFVKTAALKDKPLDYFKNPWNRFDLLIVANGWLDFFQLSISKSVSILRLLRMLRVFRLAKALPRLRSIVESLIKGFGSVLWILILMIIFNYISGCLGILLFQENDPFYFGSVLQSLFSVYQIETLDSWDVMLRVNMYGCNQYAGGYPLTSNSKKLDCKETTQGLGWLAAAYFIFVVVFGGLILPTMLIGIVTISFEESFRQSEIEIKNQVDAKVMIQMVQEDMPAFFSDVRVELLKFVFSSIDVDDSGSLDINEVAPLIKYISFKHLRIDLKNEDIRALVLLFDDDNTDDINFGELLVIIRYIIRARNLGKLVRRSSRDKNALTWSLAKLQAGAQNNGNLQENRGSMRERSSSLQERRGSDCSQTSQVSQMSQASHVSQASQASHISQASQASHISQASQVETAKFDKNDPSSLFRAKNIQQQPPPQQSFEQSFDQSSQQQPSFQEQLSQQSTSFQQSMSFKLTDQSPNIPAEFSKQLSMTSMDGEEEESDSEGSFKEMEMEKFSATARKKQLRSSYIRNMVSIELDAEEEEEEEEEDKQRRRSLNLTLEEDDVMPQIAAQQQMAAAQELLNESTPFEKRFRLSDKNSSTSLTANISTNDSFQQFTPNSQSQSDQITVFERSLQESSEKHRLRNMETQQKRLSLESSHSQDLFDSPRSQNSSSQPFNNSFQRKNKFMKQNSSFLESFTVDVSFQDFDCIVFDEKCSIKSVGSQLLKKNEYQAIQVGYRIICINNDPVKTTNDIKTKVNKLKKFNILDDVISLVILVPHGQDISSSMDNKLNHELRQNSEDGSESRSLIGFKTASEGSTRSHSLALTPLEIKDPNDELQIIEIDNKTSYNLATTPVHYHPSNETDYPSGGDGDKNGGGALVLNTSMTNPSLGSLPPLTPITQLEHQVMDQLTKRSAKQKSLEEKDMVIFEDRSMDDHPVSDLEDDEEEGSIRRKNTKKKHNRKDTDSNNSSNGNGIGGDNDQTEITIESLQHLIKKLYFKISTQKSQMSKQKHQYKKIMRELKVQQLINKKNEDDIERLSKMNETLLQMVSVKADLDELADEDRNIFEPLTPHFRQLPSSSFLFGSSQTSSHESPPYNNEPPSSTHTPSSTHSSKTGKRFHRHAKPSKKKVVPQSEIYIDTLNDSDQSEIEIMNKEESSAAATAATSSVPLSLATKTPYRSARFSSEDEFSEENEGALRNAQDQDRTTTLL